MIRLIAFDFDGTLVDSNGVKEACVHSTIATVGGASAVLEAARAVGGNRYRLFAEIARRLDPQGDPDEVRRRGKALAGAYTRCCARGIFSARERRGARAALAGLKARGIRLFVNTGTPYADLPELLRRRGLLRLIDGYFGSPAPKAANLRRAMGMCGATSRETMVVGDGPDDLEAARDVGAWFVAVTADQLIKEKARFEMRDLTSLVALVDRLNADRVPPRLRAGPRSGRPGARAAI
jgi:phosphoglycolate phosphatase-like HAD superfamily hydrolase